MNIKEEWFENFIVVNDGKKPWYFKATSGTYIADAINDIKQYLSVNDLKGEYDFIFNDVTLRVSTDSSVENLCKEYYNLQHYGSNTDLNC